jgi:hypothetical protein
MAQKISENFAAGGIRNYSWNDKSMVVVSNGAHVDHNGR